MDATMAEPATNTSAVERFWRTPELILTTMEHLRRERVDLLSLSLASKFLRPLALDALVRDLDIPLSRIKKIAYLLESNPHSIASIPTHSAVG